MKEGDFLQVGDVVQLDPELQKDGFFAGCFMLVTELTSFGAQGFICMPGNRGTIPRQAYLRPKWEQMERVGTAKWIPSDLIRGEG